MIYLVSDTHGRCEKLYNLANEVELKKNDYIIVLGDFGFYVKNDEWENHLLNSLNRLGCTLLFLDGNNDNQPLLDKLPTETKFRGKVGKLRDNIYYLKRGEVFTLNNKTFFVMGGGRSSGIAKGKVSADTKPRELPSRGEMINALNNLMHHRWKVDYVITHSAPENTVHQLCKEFNMKPYPTESCIAFLQSLANKVVYGRWLCGHHHIDKEMDSNIRIIFNDVYRIDW